MMQKPAIYALRQRRCFRLALPVIMGGMLGLVLWLGACAPNEPFDPLSIANKQPVVRMSVVPVNPDNELRATSYFERYFNWYGSDQDGWVKEYLVSIRTEPDVPAPWITTTRTDTTMTFVTDDLGNAQATFFLMCRDDRGALSDTLIKHIPLKNFPPAVVFQSDFDPLKNMQREITGAGTAQADTTFWNWGTGFFRFFASDLDGAATMDDFYRYTFSDVEPTETYDRDDPLADPLTTWVRVPFSQAGEIKAFELFVSGAEPGQVTLTVSVSDEAGADTRLPYTWEVRAPKSNILYVPDNTSSLGKELYFNLMDDRYGAGNWDSYDFWFGFPEHPFILLETMRLFDAVIWTDGGANSNSLVRATAPRGVLESYVAPTDDATPGKLLLVSKVLTGGSSDLSPAFIRNVLGLSSLGAPFPTLSLPAGKQARGMQAPLVTMTSAVSLAKGIGLSPLDEESGIDQTPMGLAEILYRMEPCNRCYNQRPPIDPIMAIRRPARTVTPFAQVVGFSMQLEYFNRAEVLDALNVILDTEMGVLTP